MLLKQIFTIFYLLLLTACGQYSFTLNENLIYSPPDLFSDFQLDDKALQACLQQTIQDQQITAADQIRKVNCSNAGIATLNGLEQFQAIEQLNLDNNAISDTGTLARLKSLHTLYLTNNQVSDTSPLFTIETLKVLHIDENPLINCKELKELARKWEGVVESPAHCRQ